ncbi:hypothetical protein B0H11DRAFT_839096 [Mycena galericulata]|nr:hypothetical protein B0H11DRAFT_839096 [Mycena galericulata]
MAATKRPLEDPSTVRKAKKTKTAAFNVRTEDAPQAASKLVSDEVDFPRGGGTTFTPLEVKAIRAEAVKEANAELFEDAQAEAKQSKKRKRKSEVQSTPSSSTKEKTDRIRIEHLNYKRLNIGMKILGQIVSIEPLALIVSLPNQLFAHVPITNISSQLTNLLESSMDEDNEEQEQGDDDDSAPSPSRIPELSDIFHPGQYIRAIVTTVHAAGSSDTSGIGKSRDEVARASRRVELSLVPERVNAGVHKSDLKAGFTLSAAVQSVEDHGYILNLGIPGISGFLSFKDAKHGPFDAETKLSVGRLLDVTVTSVSSNGRTCNVATRSSTFSESCLTEVTNANSVLPGTLVQALITAVHPSGLNLQILGFFDGTVDQFHLRPDPTEKLYKIGKKVKGRVLYDFSTTPPRFALTLSEHVLGLGVQKIKGDKKHTTPQIMQDAYPIGTILEAVKVARIEPERGIVVEIDSGSLQGFVHISHVSDDHVPSISSSGPWKPGSMHRARVTGYYPFDGLLQLSMKSTVLDQKFLQVADVQVGEVIKGTIKNLTDSGLFVSMSGNVDGVVWPNHYADISLKHPAKRFKAGASIKCRVLVVDPERKRISLTAKKTLVESALPVIATVDDAKIGTVVHAVVFKVFEKHLMVEFFNNLKALVPAREVSETSVSKLSESFPIGKVVKVRIINLEPEQGRIIASIRQASSNFDVTSDISAVEIGNIVEGTVSEIHADNAVLSLHPSQIRALISLNNLANHRKLAVAQLRVLLKVGERLEDLLVVTRNVEKSFVIVACKPKTKTVAPAKGALSMESVAIGSIVGGRVTRHTRHGALIKLTSHIGGTLHPTDTGDDYDTATAFPPVDSVLKASVIGIDQAKKQLTLSTRHSRMYPDQAKPVVDREIKELADLQVGETLRGFIKSIAEHGLFVTIGRDIDARVQIKELFDDFVKEWKVRFTLNQIVQGRILSVDLEAKKVEMTLRSGDFSRTSSLLAITDLKEGQKVDGIVNRIEDYGLFIKIDGSNIKGLCHKSQLSDNPSADVTVAVRGFREGDRVKAYILSIEKRKVSLSLKPSYFDEEDFNEAEGVNPSADPVPEPSDDEEDSPENVGDEAPENVSDDEDDAMQVDMDPQSHVYQASSKPSKPSAPSHVPSLQLPGGFQWSTNPLSEAEEDMDPSDSDDDPDDEQAEKKKKKRRKKEIEQDLTADMHTKTPQSNADFERLLLGSPNSSYLWVQYMSFQLQLSEVEKAREIARRAVQTINFREEQEKLNVWIALLNLENVYGRDETVETTFKEAARANDSKAIHLRLALIFDQSDKSTKAEEQYQRTCKKFGQSSKVWTLFSEYYLRKGNVEASRQLLPRCLQSLEKRKHLKTISRFAQLEYKLGDPERGKTLFEGIVDSHPKRLDLWSVYMDMEAGQEQIQSLRNLFDRVLTQKMTSHKAKAFFKKWLELEKRLGDEDGVANVKAKAIEWTQRANAS